MTAFWREIGVSRTRGSAYELGASIPKTVRRLVYVHHIAGIPTDLPVEDLRCIAEAVEGRQALKQSIASAQRAAALMSKAAGSKKHG